MTHIITIYVEWEDKYILKRREKKMERPNPLKEAMAMERLGLGDEAIMANVDIV